MSPAKPTADASLREILDAQLEALHALAATLEIEERAILERDIDGLDRVTAEKTAQLAQLKELEALRRDAMAAIDGPDLSLLRAALAEVRNKNRANASLIETQRAHLTALLRLLRGGDEARHYGHDGRQRELGRRNTLASA